MRLLLVEDDQDLQRNVTEALTREGFAVEVAEDGQKALELVRKTPYEVVLLDVQLPGFDGFKLLHKLRQEKCKAAILMTTCFGQEEEKLSGLDGGADDYVVKPYKIKELAARIRAVLRRTRHAVGEADQLCAHDLVLDLRKRRASRSGRLIDLTPKEFDLLVYLMEHPGKILSKETLAKEVWAMDYDADTQVVAVHINHLRAKLGDQKPSLIDTVHGMGYRFADPLALE